MENHKETEKRLLRLLNLPERDLFRGADEIVAEAYQLQAAKIAYQQQEPTLAGEQQRYGD